MDISRISKKQIQVWLPLMDGVEVLCRHLAQDEYDAILKQSVKTTFNPKTHLKQEERDEQRFNSLLARAVVLDWQGLDDAGQPFPCSPENIDYLMEKLTEFRLLVIGTPLSFERMLAAERAVTEKNLSTISAPSPITPA